MTNSTKNPTRARRQGPLPVVPYQLKVELIGIEPAIWRRIVVPSNIKLSKLNHVIQESVGWTNSHLHRFAFGNTEYTDVDFELDIEHEDESRVKLADVAPNLPSVFLYEYDFGDSWDHVVIVEDYWRGDRDAALPLCVAGARACPPEDVGGKPGYEQFLRAVLDPKHDEHENMLMWVGGRFDPEEFDLDEANVRLKRLRPRVKAVGR